MLIKDNEVLKLINENKPKLGYTNHCELNIIYNDSDYVFDLEEELYKSGELTLTLEEYKASLIVPEIKQPTNAELKAMIDELQTLQLIQMGVIE